MRRYRSFQAGKAAIARETLTMLVRSAAPQDPCWDSAKDAATEHAHVTGVGGYLQIPPGIPPFWRDSGGQDEEKGETRGGDGPGHSVTTHRNRYRGGPRRGAERRLRGRGRELTAGVSEPDACGLAMTRGTQEEIPMYHIDLYDGSNKLGKYDLPTELVASESVRFDLRGSGRAAATGSCSRPDSSRTIR